MITQKLKETFYDICRNKNISMAAFWAHRVSGILLTLFLFLHIWTLSAVFRGKDAYDYTISKFDTDFGYIFQYILLLTIAFHLLNGIRITIMDFCGFTRSQKQMLRLAIFILFIIAVIGFYSVVL